MNIAQHVERAARLVPDRIAVWFEGVELTYAQLDERAARAASALHGLGVRRGDRVALWLPNCPAFVETYLGTLRLGAIAVSVNTQLVSEEVRHVLADSGAEVLVTTAELQTRRSGHTGPEVVVVGDPGPAPHEHLLLDALIGVAAPAGPAVEMDPHDPAVILYTSGTTGVPKGATLSHGNVVSNMHAKRHHAGIGPADRLLLFLPMFHCFGQNAVLNSAFAGQATVVLMRRFEPAQVLRTATEQAVTMFFAVPTIYTLLVRHPEAARSLRSVRYYMSAAAPLPSELARRWHEVHGSVLHEGYGLTETSPFACYNHEVAYRWGSVGTPIDNVEIRVVDTAGATVAPGDVGEIIVRGPNVMLGYWNRPQDTAQAIRDGWFHTGDLGRTDEDGFLYLVDRLTDMVIVAGQNVYPSEVEQVLRRHRGVAEVAVHGLPHPVTGEAVVARVVRAEGTDVDEFELLALCHRHLAAYKVPATVTFTDSLSRGATGKVLKRELRASTAPRRPDEATERIDEDRLSIAFDRLRDAVDDGRVESAVLAVAGRHRTIRCAAFHRQAGHPVKIDSIHLLASLSKPFMAVAVLRLMEDGLIALDQPVADHIPGFDTQGKADITPRHLLTHSSGIPEVDWPTALEQRPNAAVGLAAAREVELLFAPGTRFSYSTLSFYVLAELVARRSGLTYAAYLRERICDPLGMSDTSFDPRAHQARTVPVGGITAGTDASPVEATAHYLSLAMPGAGLWSTAPDLVRFGQTLLAPTATGGLLTPATRDLMTRDHTADLLPFDNQGSFPVGYGLGWRRGIIDGRRTLPGSDRVFEHDGATGSELWIDPAADLVIVYLGSAFGADPAVWQTAVADVYSTIRSV